MGYRVPARYGQAEFIEKRSRFIGQVWPVKTEAEARELIAKTKSTYHDARHNCWCYIIHDGEILRYADDGEPQGTAGQPMLEVFRRGGIENVLCVVTRYFGGILLGAGGLTRAYGGTAKLALEDAGIAEMRLWTTVSLSCPYSLFERVKIEIETAGGLTETIDYSADITIAALLPEGTADAFFTRITELSSGTVNGVVTGTVYRA